MLNCEETRSRLTELALGDLDAEPAREVREHLASCAACRLEEAAVARALGLLKAGLPPSTERRLKAVQAMIETRESVPGRRRWMAAAAAVVLAAGASMVWMASTPNASLKATAVVGRADVFRISEGRGIPLVPGDRVHPGDRVVTAGGGEVRLEGQGVSMVLESASGIGLAADGRIALERGVLRVEGTARILDTVNNTVTLRSGKASIGLRDVRGMVAGSLETRGSEGTLPQAREVTTQRLSVRVTAGEADLDGSHQQRLRVTAGQEGGFEFDGRPFMRGTEGR